MTKEELLADISNLNIQRIDKDFPHLCYGLCRKCPISYTTGEDKEVKCDLFLLKSCEEDKKLAIKIIKDSIESDKKLEYLKKLK
jgi:hypothetical protein